MSDRQRDLIRVGVLMAMVSLAAPAAEAQMSDGTARTLATRIVAPVYPEDDVRERRSGVVVAQISTDERGLVTAVSILEAPTVSIGTAADAALRQWQFKPLWEPSGRPTTLTARIVYYFVLENGKGVVRAPADTGYVGRWPERPATDRPAGSKPRAARSRRAG